LLRKKDVSNLSDDLKTRRIHLLDLLNEYWTNGIFPKNYDYVGQRKPCFIDKDGAICAVGYLIEKTTSRQVADYINSKHKYDELLTMNNSTVNNWVLTSGLTIEECAMIQPTYGPTCDCQVSTIENSIINTELILRGEFIEVKNNVSLRNNDSEHKLYYEGKIIVLEVLKGSGINIGDTVFVGSDYSDCSRYYKMSTQYLFFASRYKTGIKSDACTFTTELFDLNKNELYNQTMKLLK